MTRRLSFWIRIGSTLGAICLAAGLALAGGGPRNVLIVVNENAEESLEIGNYYMRAREIPEANLCRLQTSTSLSITKAVYQSEIESPVMACIAASPHRDRIDYIVLTRGLPIVAGFPGGDVSVAALLQAMDTSLRGKDQEYAAPYGFQNYPNPYVHMREYFSHTKTFGGYQLYIPTMLSGYWSEEAKRLVDRSLASDLNPPTGVGGVFYLENGSGAANVRDTDFPLAVSRLQGSGYPAVHITSRAAMTAGSIVASHVNAGSYSGIGQAHIQSYTYPPGCIVDVLESFGLVPPNFTPGAAPWQTPVTWWIAAGATGGHGTVSEPYNVAFPDGFMLEPYVLGFNLGETFYQGIPYLYWMNLVLGDPLAAPWAVPPVVTIENPADRATVSGAIQLRASAVAGTPPNAIDALEFYIDDTQVQAFLADNGQYSWDSTSVADGWHRFEAVAYESTPRYPQGEAGIDLFVNNRALSVVFTAPAAGGQVAGSFAATIDASAAITDVTVAAEAIPVGSSSGVPPFSVNVDTTLLGRGWNRFAAAGRDGGGRSAGSDGVDLYVVKPPRFNSLAPASGDQAGGTVVSVDGWNFEPDIRVFFGALESSTVTWIDGNHFTAVSPPGPAGFVDVRLENPLNQNGTLTNGFEYLGTVKQPTVNLITPTQGPDTGGTVVSLEGFDFDAAVKVFFDGIESTVVVFTDAAHITAETPPHAAGSVPVRVENPFGLSFTLPAGFEYMSTAKFPTIVGLAPTEGPERGGTLVAIDGTDFDAAIRVFFGAAESTTVTWIDPAHLTAVTPPGPPGFVDVTVENPGGLAFEQANGFEYTPDPCAVTAPLAGLKLVWQVASRIQMQWQPSTDPCLASYRVFAAADPATPPRFPADYADITGQDLDGNAGGDPWFLYSPGAAGLFFYRVAGEGTDGSLGPG